MFLRRTATVLAIPTLLLTVAQLSVGASDDRTSDNVTSVPCGTSVTRVMNPDAETDGNVHIDPEFQQVDAIAGQSVTRCITLDNRSGHDLQVSLKVRNIYAAEDPGDGLKLTAKRAKYGAADWITLSTDRVDVITGDAASIPFSISAPADASSGSHPGALRVRYKFVDKVDSAKTRTATVVVNVPGHVEKEGKALEARLPRLVFHGSEQDVRILYRNTGDVVDLVDAKVTLDPWFGIGAKRTLKASNRMVLRSSVQEITLPWDVSTWFGRVTPHVRVESGASERTFDLPAVLVLPPLPLLLIALVGVAAAVYLLWWQRRQESWRAYYEEELHAIDDDEDWQP